MTSALLIIDVQQGLCEGPQAAFDSAAVIDRINAVSARARTAGLPVIFIQHESGPGYLEYGSRAWQLAQGLHAAPGDLRIRKTTPDAFLRTTLQETLESLAVRDLIICGMHSEFCVDTTTRRALGLGYPVRLMEDGHTTVGNADLAPQQVIAHHNTTLSGMSSFGPRARPVPGAQLP